MRDRISRKFNIYRARFIMSLKMYLRYPMNFILTFLQPIIWLTPFYFMGKSFAVDGKMTGFEQYTGNSDFMGFIIVGFIISSYVSTVFWAMGFSLKEEMRQGVLESNWTTPVKRIDLMISKSIYYFVVTTIEVIITSVICHFVFGFSITGNFLKAVLFMIPGIIGMFGIGMALGGLVLIAKNANPIIDLANSVISALSGSFFPIQVMGRGFMFIALGIPLTYVFDSIRAILLGQTSLFSLQKEFIILVVFGIVFSFVGSYIFIRLERLCREKGILNAH